jgi:hypothetical protein
MNHAPAHDTLELRVLSGPQRGARAALPAGGVSHLSAAPPGSPWLTSEASASDILLRSAGAAARVRLVVADDAVRLCVIDGTVRLGETPLAVGAECPWPMRQLLSVGDAVVAFGPAHEAEWPAHSPAAAAPEPAQPAASASRWAVRGAERWLAGAGVLLLIASAGLLTLVEIVASPTRAGAAALAGAAGAAHAQGPADTPKVRAVVDVFRLHGMAVKADTRADGAIVVHAQVADTVRLNQASQAARRDVAGLGQLVVQNEPPARPAAHAPLADDPGKRITAVVAEPDSPYFVTADGSRYFTGALLPSGHRVLSIADHAVTIERDGELTRLTL